MPWKRVGERVIERGPLDDLPTAHLTLRHDPRAVDGKAGLDVHQALPKTMTLALIAVLALSGCASTGRTPSAEQRQGRYELKDRSILVVDSNGRMRMFDLYGRPLFMRSGVTMELKDGTVISMKESAVWGALRIRGTLNPRS